MRRESGVAGLSLALTTILAIGVARPAGAQTPAAGPPPGGGKVAAEALFEDGRTLMAEGKYADACPKFADSQRLDPSPGTLLNLANCWEKLGRAATAWATYKEAASAANAAGRKDYVAAAERHADALASKLAHLTVTVASPVDGLVVKRDGVVVGHAEWGTPIPVDTGSHAVEASAPGYKAWVSSAEVSQDGAQVTVAVPALEPSPSPSPSAAAASAPPAAAPTGPTTAAAVAGAPLPESPGATGGWQRTTALVLGAFGLVGAGVGTALALSAKSRYDDSLAHCETTDHDLCDPQ